MPPYQLPIEIAADLRPYQREGISWLAFLRRSGLHGVLADDMGALCAVAARQAPPPKASRPCPDVLLFSGHGFGSERR